MSNSPFAIVCSTLLARRLSIVFPILYMAGLLLLSAVPGHVSPTDPEIFRIVQWVPARLQNLMHIPAYALLAFTWRWCLGGWFAPRKATLLAFTVALLFGFFEEFFQSFIPGRYPSLTDVLFDGIGALLGVWLFNRLHRAYCA